MTPGLRFRVGAVVSDGSGNAGMAQSEDGDVVVLSKLLRCLGDLLGVLAADRLRARKAEELTAFAASLHHAIGYQGKLFARFQSKRRFRILRLRRKAEGKAAFDLQLCPIAIRRQMPGVGRGYSA